MILRLTLCSVLAFSALGQATLAANYVMRDLGTLGRAYGINSHNQIVGESYVNGTGAFKWDPVTGLSSISGLTTAYDINDSGAITGVYGPDARYVKDGKIISITSGEAFSINNAGQVVGETFTGTEYRTWKWDPTYGLSTMQTLGGAMTFAVSINASGQAAGFGRTAEDKHHACIWDASGKVTDLGAILGYTSEARGINDLGQVTGEYSDSSTGFVWDPVSGMTDAGLHNCVPSAINNRGEVVGRYYTDSSYHAFYWKNGQLTDLDDLNPGHISWSTGINDNGWICGMAWDNDMALHAVAWEPVPEPSSILSVITALAGTGAFALRRRRA